MRAKEGKRGGGGEKKYSPRPLPAPFDSPYLLLSSGSFNMALSRANCALKENACTAGYIYLGNLLHFSFSLFESMATIAKVVFPLVVLAVCCVAMSRRVMLDYDDLQMTKGVPVSFPKLALLQVTIPVNSSGGSTVLYSKDQVH